MVRIGDVCQTMQTLVSPLALPSQPNCGRRNGLGDGERIERRRRAATRAITVPSLGATFCM